ncbi:LOW QUALITY PROTEIN: Hypothetical protein PHPALM_8607 [Phytophthora palmivora]|uniref:Uncharacterized protein n=1 Tax=Phytophthora palmivora TaxID=4796 RepID=A0A2P4Y9E9_9STRA|nr:LOW QUALITY PROTEIN: Hypothetical protein PHPALM_8607 [Phytophthora palmivora]
MPCGHCFGRSSNLGYVQEQQVSVSEDDAFYLRLPRVMTSGLWIQSWQMAKQGRAWGFLSYGQCEQRARQELVFVWHQGETLSSVKRIADPAGVAVDLPLTHFVAHANGDDHLAAQWIFDRGTWGMTKTNKAFAYITNTVHEDRKVARVLSGRDADASPKVIGIDAQDHATRERLRYLQELLLSTCTGLKEELLNVSIKAIGVLTTYVVRYFPQLKATKSPYRRACGGMLGSRQICSATLLAWSLALNGECAVCAQEQEKAEEKTHMCREHGHLLAVIDELIASNRLMAARLVIVEAAQLKVKRALVATEQEHVPKSSEQNPKPKRRKKQASSLSAVWYEWHTKVPRVWDSSDRQKKSEFRHVVSFIKFFLPHTNAEGCREQVLDTGSRADDAVPAFLKSRGTNAKAAGSVLRALHPLRMSGA